MTNIDAVPVLRCPKCSDGDGPVLKPIGEQTAVYSLWECPDYERRYFYEHATKNLSPKLSTH